MDSRCCLNCVAVRRWVSGTIVRPSDNANPERAGSLVTTALHVFSIMVGPGVLALPSAASWLGWVFGPILLTLFYVTCLLVSSMLVSVYEVRCLECFTSFLSGTFRLCQHACGNTDVKKRNVLMIGWCR